MQNKDDTDLDNSETYFMRSGGASSSRTSSSTIRSGAVTAAPTAAVKVSDAFASSTTSTMVAAKKQIAKTTAVIGKGLQAKVGVPPPVPPNKPAIVRSNINFQSQTQTKWVIVRDKVLIGAIYFVYIDNKLNVCILLCHTCLVY